MRVPPWILDGRIVATTPLARSQAVWIPLVLKKGRTVCGVCREVIGTSRPRRRVGQQCLQVVVSGAIAPLPQGTSSNHRVKVHDRVGQLLPHTLQWTA
jgi:hypothetical protein